MRNARIWFVGIVSGVAGVVGSVPGRASAQAVAFAPTIGTVPEGIGMTAVPVVSHDRRYVRIGVNADFSAINQIQNFNIPLGAVAGGPGPGAGGVGGAGAGAGGFRSVGTANGMDGPVGMNPGMGSGLNSGMMGPMGGYSRWDQAYAMGDDSWSPTPRRARSTRSKTANRAKQATATARAATTPAKAAPPK